MLNELIKKYEKDYKKCRDFAQKVRDEHTGILKIKNLHYVEGKIIVLAEILHDLKKLEEKIIKRQFTKSYISTNQDNSLMAVESMIKEIIGE